MKENNWKMAEFHGFGMDEEEEEAFEKTPDIDEPPPVMEDIYQGNINENTLGRLREGNERIGKPVLGKYAKARLIAARAAQLQLGVESIIPQDRLRSSELEEIAIQEFDERVIPIKIIRKYADNTYEIWTIKDFKYFPRDVGRSQRARQRKLKY
jgi:DNA-directed RNA polymerase subunit K/omega